MPYAYVMINLKLRRFSTDYIWLLYQLFILPASILLLRKKDKAEIKWTGERWQWLQGQVPDCFGILEAVEPWVAKFVDQEAQSVKVAVAISIHTRITLVSRVRGFVGLQTKLNEEVTRLMEMPWFWPVAKMSHHIHQPPGPLWLWFTNRGRLHALTPRNEIYYKLETPS